MQTYTLGAIAEILQATVQGDAEILIDGIASLKAADAGKLSFFFNQGYASELEQTRAAAVVLKPDQAHLCAKPCLLVSDPRASLRRVASLFACAEPDLAPGIHPTVIQGPGCHIDPQATLGPYCVLGRGVHIGPNVVLESGVHVGDDSRIAAGSHIAAQVFIGARVALGQHCFIQSGTRLGTEGFGYVFEDNIWQRMPHLGWVIIGNFVEIGANTCVDRGVLDDTVIHDHVIIDNLVQIAHNVIIGEGTAIAGCVAIAGSTEIGRYCLIGGGSSISGHLKIGDGVQITGTSAVSHSLLKKGSYSSGLPARETALWRRNVARFQHLDELAKRIIQLERKQSESEG